MSGAGQELVVHHLETSRSQRILWLLEELGVPYELKVYQRDKTTRLAPPELKAIHPLGKSPVITDDGQVIAESAVIIEYIVEKYGHLGRASLRTCSRPPGRPPTGRPILDALRRRFADELAGDETGLHTIPTRPMPFFAKPIARGLCEKVQTTLIDPNVQNSLDFIEGHLAKNAWFAGPHISMADFQMSFAIEALLSRSTAPVASTRTSRPTTSACVRGRRTSGRKRRAAPTLMAT